MLSAAVYGSVLTAVVRYAAPLLTTILLYRCIHPLVFGCWETEIWGWLYTSDGKKHPITHWETVIGSGKVSDLRLNAFGVAKRHVLITRYDDGSWTALSLGRTPIRVNGHEKKAFVLCSGDHIKLGEETVCFISITEQQASHLSSLRTKAPPIRYGMRSLILLTALQILFGLCYGINQPAEITFAVLWGFGGLIAAGWSMLILYYCFGRTAFEMEILALYLSTLGMCVIAAVCPREAIKQLFAVLLGIALFFFLGWFFRNLERAKKLRYPFTVAGLILLWFTFLFGKELNGAKSWLYFGTLSIQPSELVKLSLIFAGTAAMDRSKNKWEPMAFCLYSVLCCVCLGLSNDFGTALVFFLIFAMITFLRSGFMGAGVLISGALAGNAVLTLVPRVRERFATWGNIW